MPDAPADDNPWTTLDSREVYANAWMRVREDRVLRPDGRPGIYGVVSTRIATGVVAVTDDDRVVLVGQYRYPLDRYSWEIPEGGTDEGEDPDEAIARELQEEAGVVADRWERLGGEVHLSNCISSEVGVLYRATGLTEAPDDPDGTEVLERRVVPFEEAMDMVDRGEITDAMSVIGLLREDRRRRLSR